MSLRLNKETDDDCDHPLLRLEPPGLIPRVRRGIVPEHLRA